MVDFKATKRQLDYIENLIDQSSFYTIEDATSSLLDMCLHYDELTHDIASELIDELKEHNREIIAKY